MIEIIPQLFVGTREDAAALGAEVPSEWTCISVTEYRAAYGHAEELPNEPLGSIDAPFMLSEGATRGEALDKIAETIAASMTIGKKILVHCVHAHERSPLAIAWYLIWSGQAATLEVAYAHVSRRHPETENRLKWVQGIYPHRPQNAEVQLMESP
jgi:hypothetical protein